MNPKHNLPPGTPTSAELLTLPRHRFEQLVAKHLDFNRRNQWIWRSLGYYTCLTRTEAALTNLRKTLEAGIRRKEVADENPAHRQRELINARQEYIRILGNLHSAIDRYKGQAEEVMAAVSEHRRACLAEEIVPEGHDLALWAVLPSDNTTLDVA